MGQRSQIYVSYLNAEGKRELVARYFGWNYGSRMISRARGLIEWLVNNLSYIKYDSDKIAKIAEVNFDFRDIVRSNDLIAESNVCGCNTVEDKKDYIFNQDNNDGKLFIEVRDDCVAYAFTGWENEYPMGPNEYMAWQGYEDEEDRGSNCATNIKYILENGELMHTTEELEDFINADYVNLV